MARTKTMGLGELTCEICGNKGANFILFGRPGVAHCGNHTDEEVVTYRRDKRIRQVSREQRIEAATYLGKDLFPGVPPDQGH